MPNFSIGRSAFVLAVIAAALAGMTARVAYLQTYGRQHTIQWAQRQQHTSNTVLARRGTIFDRNGLPMAATVQTLTLFVDPKFMIQEYQASKRSLNQMDADLKKLCALLELDIDLLTRRISDEPDARFIKLAADLDERLRNEVEGLKIPGVGFEPVTSRWYPMAALASHVLGAVGSNGKGLEGMELAYEKTLAGKNGYRRHEKDAQRRLIGIDADDYIAPRHGRHLVLTLDSNVQMIAEEELHRTCEEARAARGEVIVMDPATGEILAMANYPTFNPQNVGESAAALRRNSCLVMPYEPGSTIKPFLYGPALEWGVTRLDEMWSLPGGGYNPYGSRRVTDVHHYDALCTWDGLVKSSNILSVLLGERMGNTRLHRAVTSFGFGTRTGIELPGEDAGLVHPVRRWGRGSTVSIPQGYELMVTPLQLARAFCVFANDGRLVRPRIVKGNLADDGAIVGANEPASVGRVLDERAIQKMRAAMSDVMVRGTARDKGSKYWNIFGKTGTSHINKPGGGYYTDLYNSSFISGAPVESPKIVVAMVVHEADKSLGYYGGAVAAPGAVRVIERTLGYMQVPASPELLPPPPEVIPKLYNYTPAKVAALP